jgi:hypothetical protein
MQQQPATRSRKPYTPSVARASYKPLVRKLGSHGLYRVQSATNPLVFYVIDTVDNTCTCPAGAHGRDCWHRRAVAGLVFFPAPKVEAALARPSGMACLDDVFGPLHLPA